MQQHCDYCEKEFIAERKDKRYCSPSCKQMSYINRQRNSIDGGVKTHPDSIVLASGVFKTSSVNYAGGIGEELKQTLESQNVNAEELKTNHKDCGIVKNPFAGVEDTLKKTRKIKTTDTKRQLSAQSIDGLNQKSNSQQVEASNFKIEKEKYIPVSCKWIDDIYESYNRRDYDVQFENLSTVFKEKTSQVEQVSKIYMSLLAIVLHFSVLQKLKRNSLIKVTNAFTVLINTSSFQELPENYPYTKNIIWLRDVLKEVCIEAQEEDYLQLSLKLDTKKELLLHQLELSTVFAKMSFGQVLSELKYENEQVKESQTRAIVDRPFRKKLWRRQFRKRKQNNPTN